MRNSDFPPDSYPVFCEGYDLHEKILHHDLTEALRRSVEDQTEPDFDLAFFLSEAEKWRP